MMFLALAQTLRYKDMDMEGRDNGYSYQKGNDLLALAPTLRYKEERV